MENAGEMHILIVEDEKDTAAVLKLLLKTKLHASSEIAPDCASARQSLASNSYDLITMDYQLPDGDGLSLFEEIVGKENAPPVVMVTGHGDERTAVSAFKLGASGYVVKDTRMSTMLVEEARSALARAGHARAEAELRESDERYRNVVANTKNGIAVYGAVRGGEDFVFKDFNKAAQAIEGVSREDVVGRSVLEVFPGVREFGLFEVFQRVWRTGVPERYPARQYTDERITGWRDNYVYRLSSGELVAVYEDVTERKAAEEALRRSEELLNETQHLSRVGGWEYDVAGNAMYWTEETYRIHGFPTFEPEPGSSEHIARSAECYEPEDRPVILAAFERCVKSGEPYDLEFPFTTADGRRLHIRTTAYAVRDAGEVVKVVGNIIDITDRKQAEEELRESEELYRNLIEASPDAIFVNDFEGNVLALSERTVEMFGYSQEDLSGKSAFDLVTEGYRDTVARNRETLTETGRVVGSEMAITRKDGSEVLVEVNASTIKDEHGNPSAIMVVVRDITDRKTAEEALRLTQFAVDHSADSVFWVTSEGKIIYANEEACRRRGYTREEMLSLEIFDINDSMAADPGLWESTRERIQQEGHFTVEFRHRTKGGEVFPVEAALNFFDLEGGWLFVANVRDITDRKQAEEALQRANMELEGYAHTVSHDLKGPLSSIATAADLLSSMLEGIGDDEGEALGIIRNSVKRALHLTENLLGLAEVGQAPLKREPMDISGVVRSILLEKEALLEERGTRVSLEGDLGVAAMDPTHAYQVFSNLIGNAIKHDDSENPEIHVSRLGEAEPGAARYLVRDNGPGIPEGAEEDIFLPFHKGPNSTDTGIGLSIVDKVVRLYGGQIRAYNDGGACFEFTLPLDSSQGP